MAKKVAFQELPKTLSFERASPAWISLLYWPVAQKNLLFLLLSGTPNLLELALKTVDIDMVSREEEVTNLNICRSISQLACLQRLV